MQYVHLPDGGTGLRKHRSHDAVVVEDCLIAHPDAREPDRTGPVTERVEAAGRSHDFTVAGDGFWQVHPSAADVLTSAVLRGLEPVGRFGARELPQLENGGEFFSQLATHWKNNYAGWRAWVLTPDLKLPGKMRLKESRRVPMWNGPIECRLFRFDMVAGSARVKKAD